MWGWRNSNWCGNGLNLELKNQFMKSIESNYEAMITKFALCIVQITFKNALCIVQMTENRFVVKDKSTSAIL